MKRNQSSRRLASYRPDGFTLIEATIVSALMGFLAVLLSAIWAGMLSPSVDAASRCRVTQEASLAIAALSQDLSGSWCENRTGTSAKYQFVGRLQPGSDQLRLCFDSGSLNGTADWDGTDIVVSYYQDSGSLIRWNESTDNIAVIARHLESFVVKDIGDGQLQLSLTFNYRDITRTYSMIARDP